MNYNDIIKVKFSLNEQVSTFGEKFTETNIEFDDLVKLITDIEENKDGFGKNLHKEAFTGINYLGDKVKFNSYIVWTNNEIIKYSFDENWVPFEGEILRRNRDKNINNILN